MLCIPFEKFLSWLMTFVKLLMYDFATALCVYYGKKKKFVNLSGKCLKNQLKREKENKFNLEMI